MTAFLVAFLAKNFSFAHGTLIAAAWQEAAGPAAVSPGPKAGKTLILLSRMPHADASENCPNQRDKILSVFLR
ncbi:MAG: hypothetical protein SVT52_00225 [Planctomycetota bacterium]|nr:hypothetical protein [Planctomycetota bacterium]